MALEAPWKDGARRTVEILGGEETKFVHTIDEKLKLSFTTDEWIKLFNVADGFLPCGPSWETYNQTRPIEIFFVRREASKNPA